MAIVIPILVSLGCGVAAGIFLGGFWWVVFGLLVGYMEAAILCFDYEDIWGLEENSGFFFIIFPPLIGAIAAGIIIGGFGWVMLGLLIGFVVGCILYGAYLGGGKLLAALLPIGMPVGAVLALLYVDRRWYIVLLGILAGALASFILSSPHIFWLKYQQKKEAIMKAEEEQRKKEEEEEKRKQKEEYERNRPIEEKLIELESKAVEVYKENSAELKKAKRAFSESPFKSDLEETLAAYTNDPQRYSVFRSSLKDAFSGSGVLEAQERVEILQEIAKGYAARYRISAAKAKLENDIYTANKKKALLLADRLKEIYGKLTAEQKKRKVDDVAKAMSIGNIKITIPDTVRNISALAVQFGDTRKEAFGEYLLSYGKFQKETNLSDGASAITFLVGGALGGLLSKHEDNQKLKEKLFKGQERLFKKIEKLESGRLQADGFSERAGELNRALEGTMKAYEQMFVEIYNSLYPQGDALKSKEAREENKKNGGVYFTNEEAEAIRQLLITGQSLLNLVDTNFEGDNDE